MSIECQIQWIERLVDRSTVRRRNAELHIAILKNGKRMEYQTYGRHGKRLEDTFPPLEVIFGHK
jgi:hypothetical protein